MATSHTITILRRLAEQNDYQTLVESCIATETDDPSAKVLLALGLAYTGELESARDCICSINTNNLDLDARVDLAAVHFAVGRIKKAESILQAAEQEDDGHPLLLARLAACRAHQNRLDDALLLFERSLAFEPRIAVYQNLLRLYLKTSKLKQAARCLERARAFWASEQQNWPEEQRPYYDHELDLRQLELWTANESFVEADTWFDSHSETLDQERWCSALVANARYLFDHDRHAQAEERLRQGLKRYPENLTLIQQLVELAEMQGRTGQAIALLRRAVRFAKKQNKPALPFLLVLARVALQSQTEIARKAASQAIEEAEALSPDDGDYTDAQIRQFQTQAEVALANIEAHEQTFDAAENRFRALLKVHPQCVPALQGLGHLCMQLGRIDEAITLFEEIKTIDPARGYSALINARRFPEDEATLEKLETIARQHTPNGTSRSSMLFQLAAAWEKRKDYQRAFALADEANADSRKLLRYDAKGHRQRCARIRHAFSRALFDHRSERGSDSEVPVFVLGMPRSGTTLVEQIIAGHSKIHGAGELGVIPRVIAGLERWERQTGSGRSYPDCIDDLDPTVSRGVAESVLSELREYAPDAARVVDKLPHNFENVGLIKFLFPNAKIISVRRDPRDIAVSNYFTDYAAKHGGMGFAYDLDWIGEQLADHNLLMFHWQEVFPEQILEIQYEDVIANPEASARRLLDYIGVDWEPQVLKFNELERPVKTASVWQVRQPIYQTSKAKWRRYEGHLAPLIAGTNRKITWELIEMATLPEPGWLNQGVAHFNNKQLDDAERCFKQLLHHLPEHAAANFMLGLVYVSKGHLADGIELMYTAHERCPWNKNWRSDLARAYRLAGDEKAAQKIESTSPPSCSPAAAAEALSTDSFATTHTNPTNAPELEPIR
ncbi:sulfotransferase [Pelagicoccus sp. SDUM812003]|uniref:tetratricopeptide repeat-containing sulfotransferase family protein n=1 Tax=Pelagicoccus sp. SDUM812003 TaxID=3041267 RepID=UPI00280F5453|nr:sulfotransferase [Pelagicoccus sp. SDUM812003]MDQ8205598.1 sulfotransferase [Pelagicoccus sp. SDUM812003]